MLAGAVKNYSLGDPREVPGGPKIVLGGLRGRPGGGHEAPKMASGGEKVPKSVQEASWSHLGAENDDRELFLERVLGGFWVPGAAFGEALGHLGAAFLGNLVADRFFIDFGTILG